MKRFAVSMLLFAASMPIWAQAPALEPKQDAKKPLWGYVNPSSGKWVVKPVYNVVQPYEKGPDGKFRALVSKGSLQGFLGPDGKPLGALVLCLNQSNRSCKVATCW